MTQRNKNILFVDDENSILRALERTTLDLDADCHFADSGKKALEIMANTPVDVVVSDMRMPEMTGVELLSQVAELYPETIRIVLTGYLDEDSIIESVNSGRIWGFLKKPWDDQELIITLEQAFFTQELIAERSLLKQTVERYENKQRNKFSGFIGSSMPMQFLYSAIERAAPSQASVFITGPSGAGKEVAAEAIHQYSKRSDKPFIALNCAAIPSELMESEIFGHVKGAFSGAVSGRDGAAAQADGGTLFLDELGEMDIGLQAKLLRFIQTGTFQKVGSGKIDKVDVRFISATNRDPMEAISDGKLREDLYYRLNVINLHLPPLRERDDDVVKIADHFLKEFNELEQKNFVGLSAQAERWLKSYEWPGNIRQLRNAIYNCVIMSDGPLLTDTMLTQALGSAVSKPSPGKPPASISPEQTGAANEQRSETVAETGNIDPVSDNDILPLSLIERQVIEQAIRLCDDNVVKAASKLEVSPSTLYRKIQSWQNND